MPKHSTCAPCNMVKPCRHLASLAMGKLSDRLAEGSAIPTNFCISCSPETLQTNDTPAAEIFACLTCFETFCSSSSSKKGQNHILSHSHTRNHSIYFRIASSFSASDVTRIEEEFFCVLCAGHPKIREPGKKERTALEKIKGLFMDNRKNPVDSKNRNNNNCKDSKFHSTDNLTDSQSFHPTPKGLVNLGNTCFMNSALQLLAATVQRHGQIKTKTTSQLWNSLIHHLEEIYAASIGNKKNKNSNQSAAVNPKEFLNLLIGKQKKFASMQQQDAHDFLRLLFNSMTTEAPQIELFGGKFVSKVTCDRCRNVSETNEPFLDISLSISSNEIESNGCDSIHSSLSNLSLSDPEINETEKAASKKHSSDSISGLLRSWNKKILLKDENGYYCENCSPKCNDSLQSASLQFFLTPQLPPFLILHLQRFKTHYTAGKGKKSKGYSLEIEKDDKYIEFPFILAIPSECILGANNSTIIYKLYGYIIHEGSSTSCGHYTAVIHTGNSEDFDDGKWFYISDTRVKEISRNRALDGETYSPYLLFYQRTE